MCIKKPHFPRLLNPKPGSGRYSVSITRIGTRSDFQTGFIELDLETLKNQTQDKVPQSYILKLQCLSVWAVPRRLFQSLPVPVECFGGWGKGESSEARGWGASTGGGGGEGGMGGKGSGGGSQHGGARVRKDRAAGGPTRARGARAGKDRARGGPARARGGTDEEGPGEGSSTGALCTGFTLILFMCELEPKPKSLGRKTSRVNQRLIGS